MNPTILASIIGLGALGLLFGLILALASKKIAVEIDPRVEKILEILPGANCGACGFAGCSAYAEAIVAGKAPITECTPGGTEVVEKIATIMGVEAVTVEPKVAVVQCKGGRKEAKQKYIYQGIEDCNAAAILAGGPKACIYGCLGLRSCVRACPFEAIIMNDNGLPVILEDRCTGCGICVDVCPRGIIKLIPRSQKVYLGCISRDKGKKVKEVCSVGCIGCSLCASPKITPSGKVHMEDNLPVLPPDWDDYQKAVEKCPSQCFVVREV